MMRCAWLLPVLALGCSTDDAGGTPSAAVSSGALAQSAPPSSSAAAPTPAGSLSAGVERPNDARLTLLAGGDVSFGRMRGQRLLREPERNDFATLAPLFDAVDLRFVNLECTISDQGGETQSPISQLVFTAPPPAAAALARARIDVVSLANNHAWDYGQSALLETFERLEAEKVAYVGAGRTRDEAYAPLVVERNGFKLAFVAVTAIWNQELEPHPGREMVADAEEASLVASVKRARAIEGVDAVIVSHHGGYEYVDRPHPGTLALLDAAVEAGADVVIGHHPHVIQRVAFVGERPVLYSVGNLLMRMVTGQPWTQFGMLARVTLRRGVPAGIEVCPFRIHGLEPIPLAGDPQRDTFQHIFRSKFDQLLAFGERERAGTGAVMGDFGADGCAPIRPLSR